MIKTKVFKIKEGKKEKWLAWCKEIMERYDEAVDTLQEENVVSEKCVIVGDYVFYKHDIVEGKEKIFMNMEKKINQKHKKMMDECLERPEIINGYDVHGI